MNTIPAQKQPFEEALRCRLNEIRDQGLYRRLRRIDSSQGARITIDGRQVLNFSSNDYLGLANDLAVREAAMSAARAFGSGSGASRLISGSLGIFHDLEDAIADFKKTQRALCFTSGYAAAVGTITALVGREDIVIIDKLAHASIVDGARLSGATLRIFDHNDAEDLERILKWADGKRKASGTVLIATESVFSMDGDTAPLADIVKLKQKYAAVFMLDEAHATGVIGESGRGLAHACGVSPHVDVQMGTLGKALGASGGFICGSNTLIDYLINKARSFVFSTAPAPASAGAALKAVELLQTEAGKKRLDQLNARRKQMAEVLNVDPRQAAGAILPVVIGNEEKAVAAAEKLWSAGFHVPAIRYPTVARRSARLRVTVTAAHSAEDVSALGAAFRFLPSEAQEEPDRVPANC
jgi:8-amino-7-oxononanoate synthase